MRESVPAARYSPVCNVLRQWKTSLILTYRVYRLYDIIYFYTCILYIYIYVYMSVRNFVYSKDLKRSCGKYSVTNCRCDVSAFNLRKSMCRLSKIDVATFEDRCIALRRSMSRCVDLRRSMCRPSEIDVLTFEDR